MANWLHQLQSLLGQQGASPSGESSKGSGLLPGAIGGLAGLLVASKSSRKLLAKYGTSALLAGPITSRKLCWHGWRCYSAGRGCCR